MLLLCTLALNLILLSPTPPTCCCCSGALLSPAAVEPAALVYGSGSMAALDAQSCLSCSATSRSPITDTSSLATIRTSPSAGRRATVRGPLP